MANQSLRVYRGKYGYYTSCSNSTREGKKYHCNLGIRFKKGMEPNEQEIDIIPETWFFSCREYENNTYPVLVITAWYPAKSYMRSVSQEPLPVEDTMKKEEDYPELNINPDDLPFY